MKARWVDVDGIRVHCLTAGGVGSPVVLLHGGGIDSASFTYRNIIGPLAARHRVFAPDWPGYGHSDKPDLGYAMGFYIDFLGHLMDAMGLERASLVGISMAVGQPWDSPSAHQNVSRSWSWLPATASVARCLGGV